MLVSNIKVAKYQLRLELVRQLDRIFNEDKPIFAAEKDFAFLCLYSGRSVEIVTEHSLFLCPVLEAFLLGVPTAISFDLVDCGDGKRGVVYETIKSTTLGEAMHSDPSRMEELTDRYVEQLNALHSIRTDNPVFGSAKDNFRKQVEDSSKYLTEEEGKLLHLVLDALPEGDRLVHCDAHPKNLMIQNGEMLWIDMEQMAVGHPIYDLISIAVILDGMRTEEMIMNIAGMSNATVALLKECFLRKYFKTEDKAMLEKLGSMMGALRLIRTVFAIGFKTPQNEKYRPAIIDMARKVFFPNIQNIVAGVKSLLSVVD